MALKVSKASKIPPFLVMQVMQQARKMQIQGQNILHLEVGQPSAAPPIAVLNALKSSLRRTEYHGYSVGLGLPGLRKRISEHYDDWYRLRVDWNNIAITPGSSLGFVIAFLSAFDRGDQVAIATPGYPAYYNILLALGLKPYLVPARSEQNWIAELDALKKKGTKPDGLLLASPANPTGVVMSDDELIRVCKWCDKHGVRLIMDEIYHGITFSHKPNSALAYSSNVIIINSFSKYFCMTGWRLGWMVLPDDLVTTAERLAQNLYISAPTINQVGAIAAFDCYDELNSHVIRYEENRDILRRGLPPEFLGEHAPSDGAFYLYADASALTFDSLDFAEKLLNETGVALTPGVDFDREAGKTFIRLSYAGSKSDMEESVCRIKAWLRKSLT